MIPINIPLGDRELVVPPNKYSWVQFTVSPPDAGGRWVVGNFVASGGSGNDIKIYILDADDFLNFQNGHPSSSYYASGKETAGTLSVGPLGGGTYYLVFDNTFSPFSNKVVHNQIALRSSNP